MKMEVLQMLKRVIGKKETRDGMRRSRREVERNETNETRDEKRRVPER